MRNLIIKSFLSVLLLSMVIFEAHAADNYWVDDSGSWHDAANWSLGAVPDHHEVYLLSLDATDRTVSYWIGSDVILTSLTIDSTGAGTMTLSKTGAGGIANASSIIVGEDGTGIIDQSDGEIWTGGGSGLGYPLGGIVLGLNEGSTGIWNLSGGEVRSWTSPIVVGYEGTGIFNITGGNVRTGDLLRIGALGTVNLSSGSIGPDEGIVVEGTYNQSGGGLGGVRTYVTSDGTINLSGGFLSGWDASINGTFNQTGGTYTVQHIRDFEGTYNLSDGMFTIIDGLLPVNGTFNYSGGELDLGTDGTLTNNGVVYLSGEGTRYIDAEVSNNGVFHSTNTTAAYSETFTNNDMFTSQNAIQYFTDLVIGADGYMEGSGNAPWFVGATLSGVTIFDSTVTNIYGESGFDMYYNPFDTGNAYLGGLDYGLTNGGHLTALDALIAPDNSFYLNTTLGSTIEFDYWFYNEADEFYSDQSFEVFALEDTGEWLLLGQIDIYLSSNDWLTMLFDIPEALWGLDTELLFALNGYGPTTNSVVYLEGIRSTSGGNTVPEPNIISLLSVSFITLAGFRKKLK